MRTFTFLLVAGTLTACNDGKDSSTGDTGDVNSGEPSGAFPLVDAATVEEAFGLVPMPADVYMISAFSVRFGDGICPQVITSTETEVEALGDCTSTDGTVFTGRFHTVLTSETDGTVTYEGWGFTDGQQRLLANGTHAVSSSVFSATGAESLDLEITFPNEDGGDPTSFAGRWTEFAIGLGDGEGSTPADATVTIESGPHVGTLVSSGEFVWSSDCGGPVGGAVTFSGSQEVNLAPQGCDDMGCIPWTAADGTTGQVCP